MKLTRKVKTIKDATKMINHGIALGSTDHQIKAYGLWLDINDDPWNTPREVVLNSSKVFDKYGSGERAELISGEDANLEIEIYF